MREEWKLAKERQLERATGGGGGEGGEGKEEGGDETIGEVHTLYPHSILFYPPIQYYTLYTLFYSRSHTPARFHSVPYSYVYP